MGGKGKGPADKPAVKCTAFEPQAWRRNLCKNCFKTKVEHSATPPPPKSTDEKNIVSDATGGRDQAITQGSCDKQDKTDITVNRDKKSGSSPGDKAQSSKNSAEGFNKKDKSLKQGSSFLQQKKEAVPNKTKEVKHAAQNDVTEKKDSNKTKKHDKDIKSKEAPKGVKIKEDPKGVKIKGVTKDAKVKDTAKLTKGIAKPNISHVKDKEKQSEIKDVGISLDQSPKDLNLPSPSVGPLTNTVNDTVKTLSPKSKVSNVLKDSSQETGPTVGCIANAHAKATYLHTTASSCDNNNIGETDLLYNNTPSSLTAAGKEQKITGDKSFTIADGGIKSRATEHQQQVFSSVSEQNDSCSSKGRNTLGNTEIYSKQTTNAKENSGSTQNYFPPHQHSISTSIPSCNIVTQAAEGSDNNTNTVTVGDNRDRQEQQQVFDHSSVSPTSGTDGVISASGNVSSEFFLPPLKDPPPGRRSRSLDTSSDTSTVEGDRFTDTYKQPTLNTLNDAGNNNIVFTDENGDITESNEYYDEDRGRLLKESLTDIVDVFDAPLSPRALDKYRKELFDSDGNIASPKSPAKSGKFSLDSSDINSYSNGSTFDNNNKNLEQQPESQTSLFYHSPEADRYATQNNDDKDLYDFNQGQTVTIYSRDTNQDYYNNTPVQSRNRKNNSRNRRRRRSRDDLEEWEINDFNMASYDRSRSGDHISREEAMMEGTRMLMDNMRDKITILEDKCEKVDREKSALGDLLSVKKDEYKQMKDYYKDKLRESEDSVKRLSAEKERLLDRLKLPESERSSLRDTERVISKLNKKLEEAENNYLEMMDENMSLKQEVKDLQTEIDEMHDQFREDEQIEFRELQRELEMNAKNCRILQFKLRKAERKNDQLEADRTQFEEKVRQLESRFEIADDKQQIRELEEELKMAKEVSVRLHDELELVEEKRARYEEELDRVNDILTDSENRRTSLQKEIDSLRSEVESYSRGNIGKPAKKESLFAAKPSLEKQSSSEYDIKQVMHDLQDSLERENDLKEQMEFRDEEVRTLKRRLTDYEQENETLDIQLQKLSSAKSGKFFKKPGDSLEREIVTEREHELRLQMELAEQELKVLRRKMDEMDLLNETLIKELKRVEKELHNYSKVDKEGDNGRSEEEKMRSMAEDIERLKWNLIEKDQEADRQRRSKTKLKKSRSLEDENTYEDSDYQIDLRRQLETIQEEAEVLRQKITCLELDNERISDENKKLELRVGKKNQLPAAAGKQAGGIPAVTTDDAAIQNIELKDRVKGLEDQNLKLRDQIKSLDHRTSNLSKEVTRSLSRSHSESYDLTESRGLRSKLKTYEEECNQLKKKISDLETKNSKLNKELEEKKNKKAKKDAKKEKEKEKEKEVGKMSKDDLKSKVVHMDEELKDLRQVIRNREDENERLEVEISEYREDMDKMFSSFRVREQELIEEMETLQNKNTVISNLLDIVTERAEYAQKELYKSVREASRSPSAVSDLSGVSVGSDEVFTEKLLEQRLEEQFMKKIEWLERNLAEERQKVHAAERKLEMTGEHESKSEEDRKLHLKEKDILQQEVTVAQGQLKDANKKVKDLRSKLDKITVENENLKEMEKKQKEQETLIKKLKEDLKKKEDEEKAKTKKSSAWIWEKQSLEADLKEQRKKVDELHAEVKRQQFKWKMAGEDIEREQKLKLQMQEELEKLKKGADSHKTEMSEVKGKLKLAEENLKIQIDEWEKEKKGMEKIQKQTDKEVRNKEDVIKQKDEILKQKEDLISQKTTILTERDDKIKKYEGQIQKHSEEIQAKSSKILSQEKEMSDTKANVKDLLSQVKDKDKKLKTLAEDVRKRDDRLQEKDDILQKLNRKLTDRENEVKDMDQTIRQAMKKLQDRESELKTTEKSCKEFEGQVAEFRTSNKEQKDRISKLEKEHSKEIKNILIQKETLETELNTLKKEKKALLNELQDNKEKLNAENEKLRKDKNKLELDLKQANERLHSIKSTSHMKESEVVKTLTSEKENLITDKHKINEELNTLRKKLREESKKWNSERDDLQKIITEKTKMLEDNSTICEKMQKDMDKLKQQVAQGSSKLTPIPVLHESSKTSASPGNSEELTAKIERQDLMYQAEKLGLEELYEGKVKNLHEQLDQSQNTISSLRAENDQQLDLIQSSRMALADLRKRYDSGIVSWNEERDHLLKKARALEEKTDKLKSVEKNIEDLKTKLQKEESKRKETENKLASEKNAWNAEKTVLKTTKKEEQSGGRGPSSSVSEFRAKFEKFGPTTKSKYAPGKTSSEDIADTKAKDESQKLVKNLQKQIKDLEKTRDADRKELLEKLEKHDKDWEEEKKKLTERNKKLEKQSTQLADIQKSLVEVQYKYHEDQEKWSLERNRTQKELEDTRKLYLEEKGQINDLLAEVKKLQSISDKVSPPTSYVKDSIFKKDDKQTKVVIKKPIEIQRQLSASSDEHITEYIQEVLQHISELVETYEKAKPLRRNEHSSAPPAFRRSLSTTEVELGLDSYLQSSSSSILGSSRYSTNYSSDNKTRDPPVRLRQYRRTISATDTSDYESKTIDRHMRGRSEQRSSKYFSGSQSAYGSRDTSPDTSKSSLPKAPPSMIISPSYTPRRGRSKDRQSLSKRDLEKLYEKLGAIDQAEQKQSKALVKERGHGIRILTKSMSVDTSQDEEPMVVSVDDEVDTTIAPPAESAVVGKRFATIAKIHSKTYEDAPLSNTLLASIRIGELVITPGVEELTKKIRKLSKKRSDSTSPHSARKSFFDNYSFSPKSYFSWPRKERSKSIEVDDAKVEKEKDKYESDTDNEMSTSYLTDDETPDKVKSKKKSKFPFFKGVKDKRKLFSLKRSSSVENSPVHSTVVQAGINTLITPGAPSTYEAPEVSIVDPQVTTTPTTSFSKQSRKLSKHHRAASVDVSVMMAANTDDKSHSSIVSSLIAQREARINKNTSATSSKSTTSGRSSFFGLKRAQSVEPDSSPSNSGLFFRFAPRSVSARWRSNPSFRLASEKPVVIRKDQIDRPKQVLNGKLSGSTSSFSETKV